MTMIDTEHWATRLEELAARHAVVGAQLGIRTVAKGQISDTMTTATGMLNAQLGTKVITDSLFEIGSITKIWTTVLIMQLVDDGLLDLDSTVRSVLPEFTLADADAAALITVRQLLDHTSGIDGDLFSDTGRGDDAVARYVESLQSARIIHPVGDVHSYCNSGFVVAGRIVEVLRRLNWDAALRQYLIEPLDLERTETLAERAIPHSVAIGHHVAQPGVSTPVSIWGIPRCMGPAGSIAASVHDLLVFATALLHDGVAENGNRILSTTSARAMRETSVTLTGISHRFSGWGLGWFLERWGQDHAFGHDGGTVAQRAYLRVLPESGVIVSLLTNAENRSDLLYRALFGEIAAVYGSRIPAALDPAGGYVPSESELMGHTGSYATDAAEVRVRLGSTSAGSAQLIAERIEKLTLDPDADTNEAQPLTLHPIAPGHFAVREAEHGAWDDAVFFEAPGGRYLSLSHRTLPKRS